MAKRQVPRHTQISSRDQSKDRQTFFIWDNPGKLIQRNGRILDTSGEVWPLYDYHGNCSLNWNLVSTAIDVKESMKAYLAHVVESQSPRSANSVFSHLRRCLNYLSSGYSVSELGYQEFEGVLVKLRSQDAAWEFGHLRRWYRWCCDRGIPNFRVGIATELYRIKVPSNRSGQAVQSRDVARGPLSDEEHWLVRRAIREKEGPLLERVCVMLLLELGARPGQLILLDEGDYKIISNANGQEFCSLDVTRLKQGTVALGEKKRRRISPDLAHALEELIEENHRVCGNGGTTNPILRRHKGSQRMTTLVFTYRASRFVHEVKIVSPRTGKVLHLNPYRLRYTLVHVTQTRVLRRLYLQSFLTTVI